MKGDFSRILYDDHNHYSLVLMQQGRVQLDSDWNEQAIIQWLGLQALARDLVGPHAGRGSSFEIRDLGAPDRRFDFEIRHGHYYTGGMLCANAETCAYSDQPDYPIPQGARPASAGTYLVYLHAWWRHLASVQDGLLRELALGGPDTTTRVQNLWQVKTHRLDSVADDPDRIRTDFGYFMSLIEDEARRSSGEMAVRANIVDSDDDPCTISPENRYRGAENQFYRVEIHREGRAWTPGGNVARQDSATMKWSRENGSVVYPVREIDASDVTVEHLGADDRYTLEPGHWVELLDDDHVLQRRPGELYEVEAVDPETLRVTLAGTPALIFDADKHPLLRRWDHVGALANGGAIVVEEDRWMDLEDGIQVHFPPHDASVEERPAWYRSGDWWWFPARTETGDVEWPRDEENDEPLAREAIAPGDQYAPLALVTFDGDGNVVGDIFDLRRRLARLWE